MLIPSDDLQIDNVVEVSPLESFFFLTFFNNWQEVLKLGQDKENCLMY